MFSQDNLCYFTLYFFLALYLSIPLPLTASLSCWCVFCVLYYILLGLFVCCYIVVRLALFSCVCILYNVCLTFLKLLKLNGHCKKKLKKQHQYWPAGEKKRKKKNTNVRKVFSYIKINRRKKLKWQPKIGYHLFTKESSKKNARNTNS